MKYFKEAKNLDELKHQYKKLAFQFHPDRGGDTAVMQEINSEYDFLSCQFINDASNDNYKDTSENGKGYWSNRAEHSEVEKKVKQAIDAIINLDGLEIEIIGVWVWVSGNTKPHKEALKNAGYIWNKTQCKWVFIGKKSLGRGTYTLDQMREKHGSQVVDTEKSKKLKRLKQ